MRGQTEAMRQRQAIKTSGVVPENTTMKESRFAKQDLSCRPSHGTSSLVGGVLMLAGLLLFLTLISMVVSVKNQDDTVPGSSNHRSSTASKAALGMNNYAASCAHQSKELSLANTAAASRKETNDFNKTTKTMWLASFPDSMDEKLLTPWVQGIVTATMNAPVKAYYLQSRILRRCQSSNSVTVFCTVVHPFVQMNPLPNATKFTAYFDPAIIYILRNPLSVFPAHHNAKAIKYHNLPPTKQVPVTEWRSFRDEYLPNVMESWKNQVRTWAKGLSSYYHVGLFLPFEHVRHPHHGPRLLQKLQRLLQDAGYPVRSYNNYTTTTSKRELNENTFHKVTWLDCLWYSTVSSLAVAAPPPSTQNSGASKSILEPQLSTTNCEEKFWGKQKNPFYDFGIEYTPPYKRVQIDLMIKEMESFMLEFEHLPPFKGLVNILREYVQEMRDYKYLDDP